MIRINLLPQFAAPVRKGAILLIAAGAVGGLIIAQYAPEYYAEYKNQRADEIRAATTEKRARLRKLQLDASKIKALESRLGDVRNRGQRILSLSEGRKQPVRVLDTLQQLHPDRMWFEKVSTNQTKFEIVGWAMDHSVVSEYSRRLKQVNAEEFDSGLDPKTFTPQFTAASDLKKAGKTVETIATFPVKFTSFVLKKSATDAFEGFPLQKFELEFNPNFQSGGSFGTTP